MADYCTECSKDMGFKKPDIDIEKIFQELEPDYFKRCLCEGCGLRGIAKDIEGIMYLNGDRSNFEWVTKTTYFKKTN